MQRTHHTCDGNASRRESDHVPKDHDQAIRDAIDVMMGLDDNLVVSARSWLFWRSLPRHAGPAGQDGKSRCFETPISELGIVGAAVGMAAYGLRPCLEIQFADYMYPAYDQIVSEAARLRYRSNGQFTCPLVERNADRRRNLWWTNYSQSRGTIIHVCGLKTVEPSNPRDAKGLLIAAIQDPIR